MSISAFDPMRTFGGSLGSTLRRAENCRTPAWPVLAFALPGEGSDHFLAGINSTGLFSRSNGQLVALQLEKSHLVLPGQKLIPGYVDLGRELVVLDYEWTGVNHERLEEGCRLLHRLPPACDLPPR